MMFWHGTRLLGTSSVLVAHQGNVVTAGGGITLPPGTLPPGSHDLTAEFSGNTDLQGSTSSSKTLVVVSGSPVVSHPPPPTSPPPVVDYEYDAVGNLTALTQAKAVAGFGFVTRHTHDALGRHQNIVDPRLGHIGLGYRGGQRELAAVKDPRDLVTHYSRNGLGQSTRLSSPDTGSTDMLHDAAGNLIASTDSRGVLTRIHYDAVNRPTSMVYTQPGTPDLAYAWTYDQTGGDFFRHGIGRLTTATFPEGSVQYAYDAHGRIAQVRQTLAAKAGVNPLPVVLTVGYTYNAAGRLASQTYPSGRKLVLDHTDGLPSTMSLAKDSSSPGTPLISNLQYAPFGPPVRWDWAMTTGPLAHVRELDVSGRMVRYRLGDHLRDIHYDAAGRITAYTHRSMGTGLAAPELDQQFGYDELGRIILVGTALNTWTYAYDATGNRTSVSLNGSPAAYAVDAASNRLNAVSSPPISFSHDAAGNITSDGHFTLAYDLRGRLTALSRPGQPTSSYAYDHAGRRVRKSSSLGSSSTVIFVYDNQGQLLGEYDSTGEAIREYVWLDDLPVAVVMADPALGPSAAPLVYLVHADHLNTPRVVVDRAGAMRWRWLAEPFGTSTPETSPSGLAAFTYNLRFPGQFYDAESGVHQNVMRDYLPGVGRYAQSDPIGLAGGINTYSYALNQPTKYTDPTGLIVPLAIPGLCAAGGCEAIGASIILMSEPGRQAIKSIAQKIEDLCRPDEKDSCEQQYEDDESDCFEKYGKVFGYSHFSFQGCMANARTRLEQCKKGLPQIPKWGDGHVAGQPPISPRRRP